MTDDMGNDLQESEINLYERYIDDPPEELIIEEAEVGHELGISEEVAEEEPSPTADADEDDEEPFPEPRQPTEGSGLHVET
ncbi:hypothetical protein HNR23_001434 [Nocardiopsis mwathae]|uniref:Uncharacterized protein n=1 Tax=Nocardiopsis mwathae TaxID=1472723 RepID=A0A7W9YFZ4_9ACTN|nr:hypothetical protein [Nocardiopsis mwathae]MBB6171374.1 hypothetical protein [Nocardiopsis mwathae]